MPLTLKYVKNGTWTNVKKGGFTSLVQKLKSFLKKARNSQKGWSFSFRLKKYTRRQEPEQRLFGTFSIHVQGKQKHGWWEQKRKKMANFQRPFSQLNFGKIEQVFLHFRRPASSSVWGLWVATWRTAKKAKLLRKLSQFGYLFRLTSETNG